MALTVGVTDWSGRDHAEISDLQRAMIHDAMAHLAFAPDDHVLDIGCDDGFLTRMIAELVPGGLVVGVDASPRMIRAAADTTVGHPDPDGYGQLAAYENVVGRPGLFRFTQMRVEMTR